MDDTFGDDFDECGDECFWCGGDGYVEAQEQEPDSWNWGPDDIVPCISCGGSGSAKDMTIW
jgi:hypothetical protein